MEVNDEFHAGIENVTDDFKAELDEFEEGDLSQPPERLPKIEQPVQPLALKNEAHGNSFDNVSQLKAKTHHLPDYIAIWNEIFSIRNCTCYMV